MMRLFALDGRRGKKRKVLKEWRKGHFFSRSDNCILRENTRAKSTVRKKKEKCANY